LIGILSSEFDIFPYSAALHYYQAQSNCELKTAVRRLYNAICPLSNDIVEYYFLLPLVQKVWKSTKKYGSYSEIGGTFAGPWCSVTYTWWVFIPNYTVEHSFSC